MKTAQLQHQHKDKNRHHPAAHANTHNTEMVQRASAINHAPSVEKLSYLAGLANSNAQQKQLKWRAAIEPNPRLASQARSLAQYGSGSTIQRVVLDHGGVRITSLENIWAKIKENNEHVLGDKKILGDIHRAFPNEVLDLEALKARIALQRVPKRGKKRKARSDEKPADFQARTTGATGNHVDFKTHRAFRMERRIRRRLAKAGLPLKGRNVYATNYENGDKRQKIVTVSQPPGALPKNHAMLAEDDLIAHTIIGHSEAQTDAIERNYGTVKGWTRISEATTREQCKDCRHNYPSTGLAHHFHGFSYSAPEDHIQDEALRKKVIANHGKKGSLTFSKAEQADFTAAVSSATYARQHGAGQNPEMTAASMEIEAQSDDSSDEYSDDEDPVHLPPYLYGAIKNHLVDGKMGKAPILAIPASSTYSRQQGIDQLEWIKKELAKVGASAKSDDKPDAGDSEPESDEGG